MNKRQANRVLNVAVSLRESPEPNGFTMRRYINPCGTPACAFGHYASRTDLQKLVVFGDNKLDIFYSDKIKATSNTCYNRADFDDDLVQEHFGITLDESTELFGTVGCGRAKTTLQAANYIEGFLENKRWDIKKL